MRTVVIPAVEEFGPDLIVASGLAPTPRIRWRDNWVHAGSFRSMIGLAGDAADAVPGGRLILVHEGGCAGSAVAFCGLAVIETLSGVRTARTKIAGPFEETFIAQQPTTRVLTYQIAIVDAIADESNATHASR